MNKLIKALHRGAVDEHRCLGCEFEDNCGIHGCQVMKKAADLLDRQRDQTILTVAEQQAIFRLGHLVRKIHLARSQGGGRCEVPGSAVRNRHAEYVHLRSRHR